MPLKWNPFLHTSPPPFLCACPIPFLSLFQVSYSIPSGLIPFQMFPIPFHPLHTMQESLHGMRDMIYSQVCLNGRSQVQGSKLSNNVAVDISFGTIGYALVLSRLFKAVREILGKSPYYRPWWFYLVNISKEPNFGKKALP